MWAGWYQFGAFRVSFTQRPRKVPNDGPDGSAFGTAPSYFFFFSVSHKGTGCPCVNSAEIPELGEICQLDKVFKRFPLDRTK